jgi:hypothetical protein
MDGEAKPVEAEEQSGRASIQKLVATREDAARCGSSRRASSTSIFRQMMVGG